MEKEDTFSYKGRLNSDSFIKRAFASLGYNFVGALMIYGILLGIGLIFGLIALVFGFL